MGIFGRTGNAGRSRELAGKEQTCTFVTRSPIHAIGNDRQCDSFRHRYINRQKNGRNRGRKREERTKREKKREKDRNGKTTRKETTGEKPFGGKRTPKGPLVGRVSEVRPRGRNGWCVCGDDDCGGCGGCGRLASIFPPRPRLWGRIGREH